LRVRSPSFTPASEYSIGEVGLSQNLFLGSPRYPNEFWVDSIKENESCR
jgi:hypothetical protein